MQIDQQIRVNELLLQREELFLRIHSAETEITRLLRGPYPFPKPALPSDRRAKRKAGSPPSASSVSEFFASASSTAARPASAPGSSRPAPISSALRRLGDDEAAYRVTYLQFNREVVETHPDFAALATLLESQAAHLRVIKIETLGADGAPRSTVFEAPTDA